MANWKTYLNSDFAGCRLLAYARDHCRNRDVRLFLIPGEWEAVGVTDGLDKWIAPAVRDIMSVDIPGLLKRIQAGEEIPKPTPLVRKARVALETEVESHPRLDGRRPDDFLPTDARVKRERTSLNDSQPARRARVQLV